MTHDISRPPTLADRARIDSRRCMSAQPSMASQATIAAMPTPSSDAPMQTRKRLHRAAGATKPTPPTPRPADHRSDAARHRQRHAQHASTRRHAADSAVKQPTTPLASAAGHRAPTAAMPASGRGRRRRAAAASAAAAEPRSAADQQPRAAVQRRRRAPAMRSCRRSVPVTSHACATQQTAMASSPSRSTVDSRRQRDADARVQRAIDDGPQRPTEPATKLTGWTNVTRHRRRTRERSATPACGATRSPSSSSRSGVLLQPEQRAGASQSPRRAARTHAAAAAACPTRPSSGPRSSVASSVVVREQRLMPSNAYAAIAFSLRRSRAQRARRCGAGSRFGRALLRACEQCAQCGDIAQAEVHALPRQRMHHVRGIADHRTRPFGIALRQLPAQRECRALASTAVSAPRRAGEGARRVRAGTRHRPARSRRVGFGFRQRPDDRAAMRARRRAKGRNASGPVGRKRCQHGRLRAGVRWSTKATRPLWP